jgi:propanol-preferring alcohol dehydrogenase
VGVVETKGQNVKDLQIGSRVGVAWIWSSCGKCDFCREGNEN